MLGSMPLLQVVGTHPLMTRQTLRQWIVKHTDVTRRYPYFTGQDNRGVKTNDVIATSDHVAPPLPLDVLLELDAEWAVIPRSACTSIDLPTREDESASFTEIDDIVECASGGHSRPFLPSPHWSGHPDGVHAGSAAYGLHIWAARPFTSLPVITRRMPTPSASRRQLGNTQPAAVHLA